MDAVIDNSQPELKEKSRQRGIRITVAVIIVFITLVMLGFLNKILSPRVLTPLEMQMNGARVFENPRVLSDFTFTQHSGAEFTPASLQGKWTLVFFGFTHCPDICPTTMATLNEWYGTLEPDTVADTQVVMVSVDPARDKKELLAQYVPYFNENFIGLRTDFLATKRFANELNVAFTKVVQGDDYTIDHSSHIALLDPKGNYYGFFKAPFDSARLKLTYLSIRSTY